MKCFLLKCKAKIAGYKNENKLKFVKTFKPYEPVCLFIESEVKINWLGKIQPEFGR